ncbi:hypothetical protein CC2G_011077 [Coprinopsis cinerea AmutBmut pab1-1]|nr:hypothetical protein CC2G_011077 [Coprinopsis cinerea AmutBmut pab1-1]
MTVLQLFATSLAAQSLSRPPPYHQAGFPPPANTFQQSSHPPSPHILDQQLAHHHSSQEHFLSPTLTHPQTPSSSSEPFQNFSSSTQEGASRAAALVTPRQGGSRPLPIPPPQSTIAHAPPQASTSLPPTSPQFTSSNAPPFQSQSSTLPPTESGVHRSQSFGPSISLQPPTSQLATSPQLVSSNAPPFRSESSTLPPTESGVHRSQSFGPSISLQPPTSQLAASPQLISSNAPPFRSQSSTLPPTESGVHRSQSSGPVSSAPRRGSGALASNFESSTRSEQPQVNDPPHLPSSHADVTPLTVASPRSNAEHERPIALRADPQQLSFAPSSQSPRSNFFRWPPSPSQPSHTQAATDSTRLSPIQPVQPSRRPSDRLRSSTYGPQLSSTFEHESPPASPARRPRTVARLKKILASVSRGAVSAFSPGGGKGPSRTRQITNLPPENDSDVTSVLDISPSNPFFDETPEETPTAPVSPPFPSSSPMSLSRQQGGFDTHRTPWSHTLQNDSGQPEVLSYRGDEASPPRATVFPRRDPGSQPSVGHAQRGRITSTSGSSVDPEYNTAPFRHPPPGIPLPPVPQLVLPSPTLEWQSARPHSTSASDRSTLMSNNALRSEESIPLYRLGTRVNLPDLSATMIPPEPSRASSVLEAAAYEDPSLSRIPLFEQQASSSGCHSTDSRLDRAAQQRPGRRATVTTNETSSTMFAESSKSRRGLQSRNEAEDNAGRSRLLSDASVHPPPSTFSITSDAETFSVPKVSKSQMEPNGDFGNVFETTSFDSHATLGASAPRDGYEDRFNRPQANEVQGEANLGEDEDRQYGPESSHCRFELSAYARCIRTSPRHRSKCLSAGKVFSKSFEPKEGLVERHPSQESTYLLAGLEGWIGEPDHGYSHGHNNSGLEPVSPDGLQMPLLLSYSSSRESFTEFTDLVEPPTRPTLAHSLRTGTGE